MRVSVVVQTSPLPYKPADLDTKKATLTVVKHETVDGVVTVDSDRAARRIVESIEQSDQ